MKVIICAAGQGRRLMPYTKRIPKCLVRIGRKRILEYALDNLSACGIRDVVIVIGYKADIFRKIIGKRYKSCRIIYCVNKNYDKTDNMYSLWEARDYINDGFVFLNADILFNIKILQILLASPYPDVAVVDDKIKLEKSAMKLKIKKGIITKIGRNLSDGNARAIGIYKYSPEGAKQYFKEIKKVISNNKNRVTIGKKFGQIEIAIERFLKNFQMRTIKTENLAWQEIDDIKDLQKAKKRLKLILKNDY